MNPNTPDTENNLISTVKPAHAQITCDSCSSSIDDGAELSWDPLAAAIRCAACTAAPTGAATIVVPTVTGSRPDRADAGSTQDVDVDGDATTDEVVTAGDDQLDDGDLAADNGDEQVHLDIQFEDEQGEAPTGDLDVGDRDATVDEYDEEYEVYDRLALEAAIAAAAALDRGTETDSAEHDTVEHDTADTESPELASAEDDTAGHDQRVDAMHADMDDLDAELARLLATEALAAELERANDETVEHPETDHELVDADDSVLTNTVLTDTVATEIVATDVEMHADASPELQHLVERLSSVSEPAPAAATASRSGAALPPPSPGDMSFDAPPQPPVPAEAPTPVVPDADETSSDAARLAEVMSELHERELAAEHVGAVPTTPGTPQRSGSAVTLTRRNVPRSKIVIDRVIVAPSGVYLIDEFVGQGAAEVERRRRGERLTVGGSDISRRIRRSQAGREAAVGFLVREGERSATITRIVEVDSIQGDTDFGDVLVRTSEQIDAMIAAPGAWSDDDIARIAVLLGERFPLA